MSSIAYPADPVVVLTNIRWQTYESLMEDLSDSRASRLTFDRGALEIRRPTPEHEELHRTMSLIVEIVAGELGIHVRNLGSSTFKRAELDRGFEPDSCFYVASAKQIRGKKRIDLAVELAGHRDLSTTQRYMHLSPAAVEGAIRLLEQPAPVSQFGDILETGSGAKVNAKD